MAAIATSVNNPAETRPTESPKLSKPMARPPRMTVKLSHERKVRSLAKKTLGSTRVGRAIRFPASRISKASEEKREGSVMGFRLISIPGADWRRG